MNAYNPYDFVPFADHVERKTLSEWLHHGELLSGYLTCKIKPLSPLCINPGRLFEKDAREVYIPGTSLKGMLRQLVSALSKSCAEFIDRDYWNTRVINEDGITRIKEPGKEQYREIENYTIEYFVTHNRFEPKTDYADSESLACSHRNADNLQPQLCRTCYLFGYTSKTSSLAGRIRIIDSKPVNAVLIPKSILQLQTPRVYHWGFYFKGGQDKPIESQFPALPGKPKENIFSSYPFDISDYTGSGKKPEIPKGHKIVRFQNGVYNGRKFYRHSKDGKVKQHEKKKPKDPPHQKIYVLEPTGVCFTQTIYFNKITGDDLGLLIFALSLKDQGLRHKLGYAKPLGAGSVEISNIELQLQSNASHKEFNAKKTSGKSHTAYCDQFVGSSNITQQPEFVALQKIWKWPGYEIAYPELSFFKKDNRHISLKQYNPEEDDA